MYGEVLKKWRTDLGMSQPKFAIYCGLNPRSYNHYEEERNMPAALSLIQMAARGLDINELFKAEIEYQKKKFEKQELRCSGMDIYAAVSDDIGVHGKRKANAS